MKTLISSLCLYLILIILYTSFLYSEPSLREKKYYADLCTKIETAQKILGQSYCILVLGIGMETQHHMKGGV